MSDPDRSSKSAHKSVEGSNHPISSNSSLYRNTCHLSETKEDFLNELYLQS